MRVFVLAVVLLVAFAVPASAQQPSNTNTSSPASTPTSNAFSKSSIDRAVASAVSAAPKPELMARTAVAPKQQKKNFFKTPWPYLIGAGVAAGILIAVYAGGNGSTGGPY